MKVRAISDRAEKKKLSERDGIDEWFILSEYLLSVRRLLWLLGSQDSL